MRRSRNIMITVKEKGTKAEKREMKKKKRSLLTVTLSSLRVLLLESCKEKVRFLSSDQSNRSFSEIADSIISMLDKRSLSDADAVAEHCRRINIERFGSSKGNGIGMVTHRRGIGYPACRPRAA